MDARRWQPLLLLVLLAATLAVFAGVRGHEFVHYDDAANIYANPHVAGLTPASLEWMFTDTTYARRYMPLGWLCYATTRQCFGLSPQAFHVINLILHLANVLLLFALLKRLLQLAGRVEAGSANHPHANANAARPQDQVTLLCAGVATLFWAVHPLRVEAVAWASSQIYGVTFLFTMLFLLAWLRAQDTDVTPARRRLFRWISVGAYGASLLTYPLALFAPMVLFALEIFPLRRASLRWADWISPAARRLWADKIPFLLVGAGGFVVTLAARATMDARFRPTTLEEFGLLARGMQAVYVWAYYLWKPLAPFDLSPSYPTLHAFDPLDARFVLSAVAVAGVSAVLFGLRRKRPGLLALWLCHLAVLVPMLGVSEYPHSAYDRYSYLHGVLWSAGLAFAVRALWDRGRAGAVAATVTVGATACFALLAWAQVPVWRDTIPLYQHIVAHHGAHPSRARFDEVLGTHYLRAGLTNEALASFTNAAHFESRRADRRIYNEGVLHRAHVRAGDTLAALGRFEEAVAHYRAGAEAKPGVPDTVIKLSESLGRLDRDAEAAGIVEEALRLQPGHPELLRRLDLFRKRLGRLDPAQE